MTADVLISRPPALSGLTLGKPTAYRDRYDATLLQAVPRSINREPLGLYPDNLPFHGADIWTLYELSAERQRLAAGSGW